MPVIDIRGAGDGPIPDLDSCDVCVVGTGPAGATVARELSGTALRVTLLESGGSNRTPRPTCSTTSRASGAPGSSTGGGVRNRIVGYSSRTCGGRRAPFDAIDFTRRSWVPGSGWPLPLDGLVPCLYRTTTHVGLAVGSGYNDDRF